MSDPTAADYYTRLGISQTEDEQGIKRAARKAQKRYHPDLNDHPDNNSQFKRVMEAYECLTDPEERSAYDVFVDRFGSSKATKAFKQWTARGRVKSPEYFSPRFTSTSNTKRERTSSQTRTEESSRAQQGTQTDSESNERKRTSNTSYSQGHRNSSTDSARNSSRRSSSTKTTSDQTATNSASSSSHWDATQHTHSNFGHRTAYNRKEYDSLKWTKIGRWPRLELGLLVSEISTLIALVLAAGTGLLLTTLLGIALVVGVYIGGTVVALVEFVLRTVGLLRFDAYHVTEIGLTWLLELGVYAGIALTGIFLFAFLFDRDWKDHIGNRIALPQVILLVPLSLMAGSIAWVSQEELLYHVTPVVEPLAGVIVVAMVWPTLHRSTRVLLEAPPNHSGESILDSIAWALFQVGTGTFLLAIFLLGGRRIIGSLGEALEYTLLIKYFSPRLLLIIGIGVTGANVLLTLCTFFATLLRRQ